MFYIQRCWLRYTLLRQGFRLYSNLIPRLYTYAGRVTCSTYRAVLFGMSRGVSCSGGGPDLTAIPSSLAVLGRILTSNAPAQSNSQNKHAKRRVSLVACECRKSAWRLLFLPAGHTCSLQGARHACTCCFDRAKTQSQTASDSNATESCKELFRAD